MIRLAEHGAKFAVFDRDEAEGHAPANDLTAKGHHVAFWAVDVTNEAALKAAIYAVTYLLPPLHAILGIKPVALTDGLLIIGIGAALFAVIEIEKQIRRKRPV